MVAIRQLLPTEFTTDLPPGSSLVFDGSSMSNAQFVQFCKHNPDLRIERDANHQLIIMAPTTSETGRWNSKIHIEIGQWNKMTNLGETFDSSTGFTLPNGAERAPDTAWIARERWEALPKAQKQSFAPIVPDFIMELRSSSDNLAVLKQKMEEYRTCGCRLGWLVDPQNNQTHVYVPEGIATSVPFSQILSGGDVMPGLELQMDVVLGLL